MGDFQDARSFCEKKAEVQVQDDTQHCLAMTYDKLGRRADAEAMLAKLRAHAGESGALSYTEIYAQWGDPSQALTWLETALDCAILASTRLKQTLFSILCARSRDSRRSSGS